MNVVAHNLLAANAGRHFNITTKNKSRSTEKLSSGYRINSAADDAAGLYISEEMRRQIRGLDKGTTNAEDGISLLQIADGALSEVSDMLHRITELSVQSANDTNTDSDRNAIQGEINQILKEINDVSDKTTFNTMKIFDGSIAAPSADAVTPSNAEIREQIRQSLLDGSFRTVSSDIAISDTEVIPQDTANAILCSLSSYAIAEELENGGYIFPADKAQIQSLVLRAHENTLSFSDGASEPSRYIGYLNSAKDYMQIGFSADDRSSFGNAYTFYNYATNYAADTSGSPTKNPAAYSTSGMMNIASTLKYGGSFGAAERDFSAVPSSLLIQSGISSGTIKDFSLQLRANYDNGAGISNALNICQALYQAEDDSIASSSHYGLWIQSGASAEQGMFLTVDKMNTNTLGINGLDVSTASGSQNALARLPEALTRLMKTRSNIGATQNRLEYTVNSNKNASENTSSSESRIRDTDIAKEMVSYAKANILEQVGQSMITQANQSQQGILTLLQ